MLLFVHVSIHTRAANSRTSCSIWYWKQVTSDDKCFSKFSLIYRLSLTILKTVDIKYSDNKFSNFWRLGWVSVTVYRTVWWLDWGYDGREYRLIKLKRQLIQRENVFRKIAVDFMCMHGWKERKVSNIVEKIVGVW